jgi:hypothetical protein
MAPFGGPRGSPWALVTRDIGKALAHDFGDAHARGAEEFFLQIDAVNLGVLHCGMEIAFERWSVFGENEGMRLERKGAEASPSSRIRSLGFRPRCSRGGEALALSKVWFSEVFSDQVPIS